MILIQGEVLLLAFGCVTLLYASTAIELLTGMHFNVQQ